MNDKNAFPYIVNDDPDVPPDVRPGLTRRELIAAMAMQGILASDERYEGMVQLAKKSAEYSSSADVAAATAVQHTDALIAELDKPDD